MATKTALVGQVNMTSAQAQAAIAAVNAKIAALQRTATRPVALRFRGPPPQAYPTAAIAALNQQQSRLVNVNGQVVRSQQAVNARLQQSGSAGQRAGAGILEVSRGFEDAQYGMRGVLNNIPGVIQSFGGGPGLAGAASILAVSLSIASNYMGNFINASENLKKANEEAAASYRQLLKDMEETSEKAGRKSGNFEAGKTEREDAGRANYDKTLARQERLLEVKEKLAAAEFNLLEGAAKARAEEEQSYNASMRKAKEELAVAEQRKAIDDAALPDAQEKLKLAQEESDELEKQMKRREREWRLLKEAEDRENKRLSNETYRTHEYDGQYQPLPRDVQRAAFLRGQIPGLESRRDTLQKRSGDNFNNVEDLRQKVATELPTEHKAKMREVEIEKQKEDLAEFLKSVEAFVDDVGDGIDEAGAAAARILAKKAERERAIHGATNAMAGLFTEVSSVIDEMNKQWKQATIKLREQQTEAARTQRDLAISEIRNPRARRRAQRAAAIKDRANDLVDKEGLSPAAAADVAAREQKVKDRDSGDRTINGAGPARQAEGLGFDFRQTKDRPIPEKKTDAEKRGKAAIDKADSDIKKSGGGTISDLSQKLQELIQVTRDLKAPGESGKPLRTS